MISLPAPASLINALFTLALKRSITGAQRKFLQRLELIASAAMALAHRFTHTPDRPRLSAHCYPTTTIDAMKASHPLSALSSTGLRGDNAFAIECMLAMNATISFFST